jgi:predicted dehydrogenase
MKLATILIGSGRVGAGFADDPVMARHYPYATHAQVLADHPAFEWSAVVDRSAEAVAKTQERWSLQHASTDLDEVLRSFAPDVAVLATPPAERIAVLAKLPSSLKAVVVEKPLGANADEAGRFLADCEKRGIRVQVNYWRRADDNLRKVAADRDRLLGELQGGLALYGNGLRNNGSHIVDMLRMILGEPRSVRSVPHVARDVGPGGDDVHITSVLTWGNNASVTLSPLAFEKYRENGADLWGSAGRITILQEGLRIATHAVRDNRAMQGEREIDSDAPHYFPPTAGHAFRRLYDDLAEAIATGRDVVSTGASALLTARIVAAIEQSANDHHAIELP